MDQLNPYEASAETAAPRVADADAVRATVDFRGGIAAVLGVGIVAGVFFIVAAIGLAMLDSGVLIFSTPLISFSVALLVTYRLLRGSTTTFANQLGLAVLLSIPATLLFLPVCTACGAIGAIAAESTSNGLLYGEIALALITIICFAAVLLLFAFVIRNRARTRYVETMATEVACENPLLGSAADAPLIEPFSPPQSD